MPIYSLFGHPNYIICIHSKHLYTSLYITRLKIPLQSGGQHFVKFSFIALRRHLDEVPVANNMYNVQDYNVPYNNTVCLFICEGWYFTHM